MKPFFLNLTDLLPTVFALQCQVVLAKRINR